MQHEYFYKDPKACDPAELPQYEASHEMDMKQKRSRLKEAGPHAPHADNGHDMKRQRLGGPPLSYPPQGYAFSTCPVACMGFVAPEWAQNDSAAPVQVHPMQGQALLLVQGLEDSQEQELGMECYCRNTG